ncbi:MAG: alpha/beta hydrolase [Methylocystis sp.]|uniref:alpha/beta hydrolase n=1 Tax=Methylocystis sp. TaxID=1911079 RepID=UPI003DA2632D
MSLVRKTAKWLLVLTAVAVTIFLGFRMYDSLRGPPLDVWHIYAPQELSAEQMDAANWADYLAAEERVFDAVRENVTRKLASDEKVPFNRYFEGSPVYPGGFPRDWNRSYVLEPEKGPPSGAVVLLHGLTDSPYSLRHIAARYRDRGFVVVAIRLPAHGTTPAALTKIHWPDWIAAARLAVREARRRAPANAPLHLVGFSNGGTIALKYALDAIENKSLARADQLVLISPMVGVTSLARFAGLAGLPAILPAFAKAAWLSVMPEFNPFKYNSFPVNGARQSDLLTRSLQTLVASYARNGRLAELPPVLTFQSVMDFTVSTPAVLSGLYDHLPANGSELVLFDLNRNAKFGPLFRESAETKLSRILPAAIRAYRLAIVTNAGEGTDETIERVVEAGATSETSRRLGIDYPKGVFSLSHVALPFPLSDALYGLNPDKSEDFGVSLGALDLRGERGTLVVSLDALSRMSSNPFFSYLAEKIEARMPPKVAPIEPERAPLASDEMLKKPRPAIRRKR